MLLCIHIWDYFSREILGCYQISGGFSDEILWGICTGLLNIREYENNGSSSGTYSVIRPSFFFFVLSLVENNEVFKNDKEALLWFTILNCILECPFFSLPVSYEQ